MTDAFDQIAQDVITGLNALFGPKTAVPAPGKIVGHVTVPIITAPVVPVTTSPLAPVPSLFVQPGTWTVAAMTAEILRNEGGFVDDPNDSGGATNFGISTPFLAHHADFFKCALPVTVDEVKAITAAQAASAYLTFFFKDAHYDLVPNQGNIIMQLFDMAVNMGVNENDGKSPATTIMQRAIGSPETDGIMDADDVAAVNAAITAHGAVMVNNAIVGQRIQFYNDLARRRPKDAKFLKGWTSRSMKYKL